jgi:transposase
MSSATCARFGPRSARRSRLSRSIPTRPTGGRCGRCSRTPPLSAIPFTSSAARTPRSTRSDASASGWPGANAARAPGARGRSSWKQQLYHARHRLLRGRERLSARDRRWLCTLFEHEPLIAEAWGLKEAFRAIYRSRDRRGAEVRLERFLTGCRLAAIPSFEAFAQGVRLWREELLAYFDEPLTNGYAEGVINKIKVIKRRAYGLQALRASVAGCS